MMRLTRDGRRRPSPRGPAAALVLLSAAACHHVPAAPAGPAESLRLEQAAAQGESDAAWLPAGTLERLAKSGDAGRLRVVRDGREVVYRAFVLERTYTPARGNGDRGLWDRRSAVLVAWREEDARDHFVLRAGARRGEFVAPGVAAADDDGDGTAPRPWLASAGNAVAVRGAGDVRFDHTAAGGRTSCDGLASDAGGSEPSVDCSRASYTVDASARLRVRAVTARDTAATYGARAKPWRPTQWTPGEHRLEIPPQAVPGRRLVIRCDETAAAARVGCGFPVPTSPASR